LSLNSESISYCRGFAYRLALPHWGELGALYASAVPPVVWSLVEFARTRRVDALSVLVLLGIALSVVLMALGGSPRLLLMREIDGLRCYRHRVPAVPRNAAPAHLLSRSGNRRAVRAKAVRARFEALWNERPALRRSIRLMTGVWGLGLTGENALRSWLAWHWPIERFLVVFAVHTVTASMARSRYGR